MEWLRLVILGLLLFGKSPYNPDCKPFVGFAVKFPIISEQYLDPTHIVPTLWPGAPE